MKLLAPAKLNLFLHITGRRSDGYHNLQTLFQLLDYGDWLRFTRTPSTTIELICPGLDIPAEQNLVVRAARILQEQHKVAGGVRIEMEKRLPVGGGLGGGSSNAATTLLALNRLWQLHLSTQELAAMGLVLGADVPVFVHGHSAWAEGIGEQLRPLELPEQWYLVVAPDCTVSTAKVFSQQQLTRNTPTIKMAAFFTGGGANDCAPIVRKLYPEVDKALIWLENFGQARMSGTGACVFLALESEARAKAILEQLPERWRGFTAKGINHSPALATLG